MRTVNMALNASFFIHHSSKLKNLNRVNKIHKDIKIYSNLYNCYDTYYMGRASEVLKYKKKEIMKFYI